MPIVAPKIKVIRVDIDPILSKQDEITTEIPTGAINGINTVFTTTNDFTHIWVYMGLRQTPGLDFNVTGSNEITFTSPPTIGSTIIVDYS